MTDRVLTDEELFSAVKNSDRKAFNMLYDRYWEIVYKKAYSYLRDGEVAGEIVNDIFINIWVKKDLLNIITFENYLTASARYGIYNYFKAKKRGALVYIENYDTLKNGPTSNLQDDPFVASEIYQQIIKILEHLPKRCKEIFLLSRFKHLSNSEIAAKLQISKRTVENQLSTAVKHVRSNLSRFIMTAILAYMLGI